MLDPIIAQLPSLGVSGLLFVMWWSERHERVGTASTAAGAVQQAQRRGELNEQLLEVIGRNTEALVALREELRSHRENEKEWVARLSRQLEQVGPL